MDAPPPEAPGKIQRTIVLADDDAVFGAYKAQMGTTLAQYDRVEMPSYVAAMGGLGLKDRRDLKSTLAKVGLDSTKLAPQHQKLVHRLLRDQLGTDVTVLGLPPEVQRGLNQLAAQDKSLEHLRRAN
jgi:hypothetical protein